MGIGAFSAPAGMAIGGDGEGDEPEPSQPEADGGGGSGYWSAGAGASQPLTLCRFAESLSVCVSAAAGGGESEPTSYWGGGGGAAFRHRQLQQRVGALVPHREAARRGAEQLHVVAGVVDALHA